MNTLKILFLFFAITGLNPTIFFAQETILENAERLLNNNQFEDAIKLLEANESAYNSNAEYHYLRGKGYIDKLNNTENFFKKGTIASIAKQSLSKAIGLKPSHVNARILLGNYYMNAPVIAGGSFTKAKEQANEILKYDLKKGYMLLASIHLENEDYEDSRITYMKVLEQFPEDEKIRYRISNLHLETKDYEKAFEFSNHSIEKFPSYLMGYYQYAKIASIANQNIEKAILHINYFIENFSVGESPQKHWAYYRLALLKKTQGKEGEAQEALNNALKLKPDFQKAKKLLK